MIYREFEVGKFESLARAGARVAVVTLCCMMFTYRGVAGSARISGEVGFAGELYNVSAGESRRPSSSARLFLRPTITLYNSLSLSLDLTLSTEGSAARQDINQFHTNPKWRWGEAHLGDFAQAYSSLSLNGVQIRGGGLALFAGAFHVSAVSGVTRREVSGVNNYRSYKRRLSAARIGLGNQRSSHVSFIVVSARDDLSATLDAAVDSTTVTDTTLLDSVVNPSSVTPMENVVVALETQLSFANNRLVIQSEVAGAALTRDRRSSEIETNDVPDVLTNLFTPRISTSGDYAHHTQAKLKLNRATVEAGYKYVGPGYNSLGLATQRNDVKELTVGATYNLKRVKTRVNVISQTDNLIGQKAATTKRNRVVTSVSAQVAPAWSTNLSVSHLRMTNDAVGATNTDYHNLTIGTNNVVTLNKDRTRSLLVNYSYVNSGDDNPLRASSELKSHRGRLGARLKVHKSVTVSPSVGLIRSFSGSSYGWLVTQTYTWVTNYIVPESDLKTTSMLMYSTGETSNSFRTSLKVDYPVVHNFDSFVEIAIKSVNTAAVPSVDYNEVTARFGMSRSF